MSTRRFFVLDDTIPSSEIPHMMCRVVEDKLRPLDFYTPSKRGSLQPERHSPVDIIPDILPKPFVRKVTKDQVKVTREQGLGAALGAFFEVNTSHSKQEEAELQTKEVKQYSLENPTDYFDDLIENENYQADLKKFLLTVKRRRGYLVTGFLTTTEAILKRTTGNSSEDSFTATIPTDLALAAAGVPVPPGLTNPSITPRQASEMSRNREMVLGENEIFAVSYSPVKAQWRSSKIVVQGGLRAKKDQLAYGEKDSGAEIGDISEVDISKVDFSEVDVDIKDEDAEEDDDEDGVDGDTGAKKVQRSFFSLDDE